MMQQHYIYLSTNYNVTFCALRKKTLDLLKNVKWFHTANLNNCEDTWLRNQIVYLTKYLNSYSKHTFLRYYLIIFTTK